MSSCFAGGIPQRKMRPVACIGSARVEASASFCNFGEQMAFFRSGGIRIALVMLAVMAACAVVGVMAITGASSGIPPMEPRNTASPKANIPPSEATIQ